MAKNVYSVSQINSYIKNMFDQDYMLGSIQIRGEISNLKYHSSGHIYFSLKDEKAVIACVMFRSSANTLTFRMKEGMSIVAGGSISVYAEGGKYQLYVTKAVQEGQGNLAEQFEALKIRLEEKGLFAPEYKQPIPFYSQTIGVVTAPTGAVIQDIINVTTRRNPYVQLILCPALVQGEGAKESIVHGIRRLEAYGVDVIIVGRGGGSMEDLWAFNEEMVAQAIFDCSIPIISAVGHETDFTIADFAADLRAPTPSAAAELAVRDIRELQTQMEGFRRRLDFAMTNKAATYRHRLQTMEERIKRHSPGGQMNTMREKAARLEDAYRSVMKERLQKAQIQRERMEERLRQAPDRMLRERKLTYERLSNRLLPVMDRKLQERKTQFGILLERMKARSPLDRLGGGYVYAADAQGRAVKEIAQVQVGDRMKLRLRDGQIVAQAMEIQTEDLAGMMQTANRGDGE